MARPSPRRLNALPLLLIAATGALSGCAQSERPSDHGIRAFPPRDKLVEAVPIWVTSGVVDGHATAPIYVELDQDAGVDEPIVIQPMLANTAPTGMKLEDVLDLPNCRLQFTIRAPQRRGDTVIKAKGLPAGSPPVTVWLVVPDDKNMNTALGTLIVRP